MFVDILVVCVGCLVGFVILVVCFKVIEKEVLVTYRQGCFCVNSRQIAGLAF